MKPSTLLTTLIASATISSASPLAASDVSAIIPCSPGQKYCGWTLIDQFHWDSEIMRQALCNEIHDCVENWSHPWDSVWRCDAAFHARPVKLCGGGGSCKPNNVGC